MQSTLSYVSFSLNSCRLYQLSAFIYSQFALSREEANRLINMYLLFDRLRLGMATLGDLTRIQTVANIRLSQAEQIKVLTKLGLQVPFEHQHKDKTLVGVPFFNFMMYLSRDQDLIAFKNVKLVFELLDYDKNGIITERDLESLLNPICVTREQIDHMFKEVSSILKENVEMTGISLVQFRNLLLQQCNMKRNKLTDFMSQNRSMALIKECREIARCNKQRAKLLQKQ